MELVRVVTLFLVSCAFCFVLIICIESAALGEADSDADRTFAERAKRERDRAALISALARLRIVEIER